MVHPGWVLAAPLHGPYYSCSFDHLLGVLVLDPRRRAVPISSQVDWSSSSWSSTLEPAEEPITKSSKFALCSASAFCLAHHRIRQRRGMLSQRMCLKDINKKIPAEERPTMTRREYARN